MRAEGVARRAAARGVRTPAALLARALCCAALLIAAAAPISAEPGDVIARARAASAQGQRGAGLALLEAHLAEAPRDVDARLVYGLLLSWEGRYDDARRELTQVLEQAPDYLDAQIALMNVERWAQRDAAALALAHAVLAKQPGQPEARAVAEQIGAREHPFSLTAAHTRDWFDDGRAAWGETAISLARATRAGSLLARASHAQRFGQGDQLIELEAYPRFRVGTYAYVGFGAATQSQLYPDWRLGLELYQSLPFSFEVSAGYRRLEFSNPVDIAVTSLSKYLGNWMLTARVYHVPAAGGADSTSYFTSVRRYFGEAGTSYVGMRYGHGFAREELRDRADLVNVGSDSLALELDAELAHRLRLGLTTGFSRQDRAALPGVWQATLSTSLGVRF